ncbi:MAG: hypothetical protein WAL90_11355 [Desulfobacterales bacterium]
MRPSVDRTAIRLAVEKARELFDGIEADHKLSTPQTISLYLWLIDYEMLNIFQPMDRLHRLLISCLENHVVTRCNRGEIEKICCRFLKVDKTRSTEDRRKVISQL